MSRTIARRVGPALVLLLLLAAWETGVRVGRVPAYLLPPPSRIVAVFFDELPALLPHAGATLLEIAAGLAGGVLAGIALALAIFYLPPLESTLYPLVIASQVIPVFAIAPLLVVWLGYGLWAKAAVAALIVFFPVTVNALDGLRAAQSETLDVLRALGASEARLFRLVRAPGSLPSLFSGLKIGVTQSVVGATIGEWIGAQRGLGYLMIESNALLRIDLVFASILALTLVGLLLFALVRIIERRALRWRAPEGVALDFFPNPNHVPLYAAVDHGFFAERGVEVEIVPPGEPSYVLRLAATRTVEVALTPQMNFLIAKDAGLPLLAIAALIGRSLGGLLSLEESGITTLADLAGKTIGYSLSPLEPALWRTVLACAGLDPRNVELVNIGMMNTVQALLLHQVDAIGAFRNFEPLEVELEGKQAVFFPQEAYCVPETYEVLAVVHPSLLEERRADLEAFVSGLAEGIAFTKAHPDQAFAAFLRARPDLDDELNHRSYAATLGLYADGARHDDSALWETLQAYLHAQGLMAREYPLQELYVRLGPVDD